MAINKEGNAYTFLFSVAMVVVVGAVLSSLAMGLKPRQVKNQEIRKQMDILSAVGIDATRDNAQDKYEKHIVGSYVISSKGEVLEDEDAFYVDVRKQIRDKTIAPEDRLFPIFEADLDGEKKYVLPVVGSGLWGPVWGYIAIGDDLETIKGASFDHKSETPGLGAEINQAFFQDQFIGAKISKDNKFAEISVVKDGTGSTDKQKVDGITGGTITSKGVEEMVNRTMRVYQSYFNSKKQES